MCNCLFSPITRVPVLLSDCWLGTVAVDVELPPSPANGWQAMLGVDDMNLPNATTARQFVAYLQSAFGLHFDSHGPRD